MIGSCVVSECKIGSPLPYLLTNVINVLNVYCFPQIQPNKPPPLTKIPINERIDYNINDFINIINESKSIRGGTRKKQKMIYYKHNKTRKNVNK